MKKKYVLTLTGFLIFTSFMLFGCISEDDTEEAIKDNYSSYENCYNDIVSLPNMNIFSTVYYSNSTRSKAVGFPSVTKEDLNYLSSLSQNEFKNLRDSLAQKAGGGEVIDSLEVANYMSLYLKVTNNGKEPNKMTKLKDYCIDYLLNYEQGSNLIENSEYADLSSEELEIYAYQSAFIDKVSRPIYEHIYEESLKATYEYEREGDHVMCMLDLGFKLALAGVDIGVGAFLDAMSGGIGTEGLIL